MVTGWWLVHTDRFNEVANEEDYDDTDNYEPVRVSPGRRVALCDSAPVHIQHSLQRFVLSSAVKGKDRRCEQAREKGGRRRVRSAPWLLPAGQTHRRSSRSQAPLFVTLLSVLQQQWLGGKAQAGKRRRRQPRQAVSPCTATPGAPRPAPQLLTRPATLPSFCSDKRQDDDGSEEGAQPRGRPEMSARSG